MRGLPIILALAAFLATAGCDDGGEQDGTGGKGGLPSTGGTGGDSTGDGGVGGGGSGGSGGGEIVIPTDEVDSGWTPSPPASLEEAMTEAPRPASCKEEFGFFTAVRGWVVAPGGKPLADARAQFCVHTADGGFFCLMPVRTDEEGVYTFEVPEEYRCLDRVAMRILLPKANRATTYCSLDRSAGPAVRLLEPSVLPFALPAAELPPLGDEDAPREVTFDDGLVLEVTPSLFFSSGDPDAYHSLSGRRIPTDAVGLCGEAATFDGLYAFYPEASVKEGPGISLRIPNEGGLPAGEAVELFVLGGLDCKLFDGTAVPEATWGKFGEGRVSEDGTTIVSGEGSGLPCFTWLAYRLKELPQ